MLNTGYDRRVGEVKKNQELRYKIYSGIGELLITISVILGAYLAYEFFVSNLAAQSAWDKSAKNLQHEFRDDQKLSNVTTNDDQDSSTSSKNEKPFALMSVPKLWPDSGVVPIYKGTDLSDLANGLGHYAGTALPGNIGNFAIAGHRATHGEPFARFDLLTKGDKVLVETEEGLFTYSLVTDLKVSPEDVWVLDANPKVPELKSFTPGSKLITLTTCDPRWSSENRWIWYGVLDSFVARSDMSEGL